MALEDKLKKLAERKAAEQSFDWNAERDKWLRALGRIYTDIEGWMQPYVAKKLATTRRTQIELSEEKIGKYKCQVLEIDFSGQVIRFEPVGTLIIGAWGRIDIQRKPRGLRGETMLTLENSREAPEWALWFSGSSGERRPFTQETLEGAIELWIDE